SAPRGIGGLSPMRYLDKAMNSLRDLGLIRDGTTTQDAPIVALLQQISDLDEERVVAITRTLAQASLFNDVVREQVAAMEVGTRYEQIANSFNSIRDDAKALRSEERRVGKERSARWA